MNECPRSEKEDDEEEVQTLWKIPRTRVSSGIVEGARGRTKTGAGTD